MLASSELAEKFFHDFAGLVMMPVAVMLMFGELWLMDKLKVPETDLQQGQVIARAKPDSSAGEKRMEKRKQHAQNE